MKSKKSLILYHSLILIALVLHFPIYGWAVIDKNSRESNLANKLPMDDNARRIESSPILGNWITETSDNGLDVKIILVVKKAMAIIISECSFSNQRRNYKTTTTLKLKVDIDKDTIRFDQGYAYTNDGPLNCPIQSEGGISMFKIIHSELQLFAPKTGEPIRMPNGDPLRYRRLP